MACRRLWRYLINDLSKCFSGAGDPFCAGKFIKYVCFDPDACRKINYAVG